MSCISMKSLIFVLFNCRPPGRLVLVVMYESVLVTYWSQVCRERARGWGARQWRTVAVSMTEGAFTQTDESLLVPLHPLQLLISTHLPPLLLLLRLSRVQTLQGTFWSLLRGVGGRELITRAEGAAEGNRVKWRKEKKQTGRKNLQLIMSGGGSITSRLRCKSQKL